MKKSIDNKEIPSRIWYYLLDWIDSYQRNIILSKLTYKEIMELFKQAYESDQQGEPK